MPINEKTILTNKFCCCCCCYFIYLPVCFRMRLSQKHFRRAILVQVHVSEAQDDLSKTTSVEILFYEIWGKIASELIGENKLLSALSHREIYKTILLHICIYTQMYKHIHLYTYVCIYAYICVLHI